MTIALFVLAALMIIAGLAGTILPALPGIPLLYGGMFLAAWTDGFSHVGGATLTVLGVLCVLALIADFFATLLGAKRVGASTWALGGAALGTLAGFFFGLPGLLLGPFAGALGGELLAGSTVQRATHVGINTWLGLLLGTLVKVAIAFMMLGLFAFIWLVPHT